MTGRPESELWIRWGEIRKKLSQTGIACNTEGIPPDPIRPHRQEGIPPDPTSPHRQEGIPPDPTHRQEGSHPTGHTPPTPHHHLPADLHPALPSAPFALSPVSLRPNASCSPPPGQTSTLSTPFSPSSLSTPFPPSSLSTPFSPSSLSTPFSPSSHPLPTSSELIVINSSATTSGLKESTNWAMWAAGDRCATCAAGLFPPTSPLSPADVSPANRACSA